MSIYNVDIHYNSVLFHGQDIIYIYKYILLNSVSRFVANKIKVYFFFVRKILYYYLAGYPANSVSGATLLPTLFHYTIFIDLTNAV